MNRGTRRFIFYIFLVLFIIIALGIILYAQGYNFDWQKKALVKTGAFYFKSYPKEADIYINDQYLGKTDKFIKRLFPEKYNIKISKPNYYDWQKTLEIKSKLVTEAQNILLVKKNPQLNLAADNVKSLFFSPDKNIIIYTTDLTSSQLGIHSLNLSDNSDIQIYPIKNKVYPYPLPSLNSLFSIFWSNNNEKVILSFSNNHYFVLNLKNPEEIIDINNLVKTLSGNKIAAISSPLFYPQDSNKIYFYSQNSLYLLDIYNDKYKSSISSPAISNILTYNIINNKILYIDTNGEFYKTDLSTSSLKKLFDVPVLQWGKPIIILNEQLIVAGGDLYFLNPQNQIFRKITEGIEDFSFSKDKNKMLWKSNKAIGVLWLEPEFEQPQKDRYSFEIIIKSDENIKQVAWYSNTDQYIIFSTDEAIKIVELDSRDKRNTSDIILIKNPEFFYNETSERIYILNDKKLYWLSPV